MKKIILLSLACVGLATATPITATALNSPGNAQGVGQEKTPLLAQYNQNYRRDYNRQYAVYYRSPRYGQWTLEGSHSYRREAELAERRLERRGYLTYIRESMYGRGNRDGDRNRDGYRDR
jgi:hypothetical protein